MLISSPSFRFTVLNDLHFTAPPCRPWLESLIHKINRTPNNELILILGDLAETGSLDELQSAKQILDQLHAPYYTVPGNHDGPPNRPASPPFPPGNGLASYNQLFPNRRNYTFTHHQWQFLALDTTDGSGYQNLPLNPEARNFAIHAAATLNPTLPTILFTHFPLHPNVQYSLSNGLELLQLLAPLNLRIVFSGHYHGLTENAVAFPINPPDATTNTPSNSTPPAPTLKLLTNRGVSRIREIHDNSNLRGYFDCQTHADQSVSYQFIQYAGQNQPR